MGFGKRVEFYEISQLVIKEDQVMVKKLIVHGSFVSKLLVPVLVGVFLFAPFQAQVATS